MSDDQSFYQRGSDGGLLSEAVEITRLQLAPGERAEVLLNLTGMNGQTIELISYASEFQNGIYGATYPGMMSMMTLNNYNPNPLNGNDFPIMSIQIGPMSENPVTIIPGALVEVNPIPESSADITRELTFTPSQMGPDQLNHPFLINGTGFDKNIINYSIQLNNIEIWSITNQSAISHPFHIHDVQFFVLDRNGSSPPPGEQGYKDVILIKPMETVRFITQFTDFANDPVTYMYHCHMLAHEDDGMMGQFEVVENPIGISQEELVENDIGIYPNPTNGKEVKVVIKSGISIIEYYELTSVTGNRIIHEPVGANLQEINLNLSTVLPGTYVLKIKTPDKIYTEILIKN